MAKHRALRTVSIAASLAGAVFSIMLALRLFALRNLLDYEYEREGSGDARRIDNIGVLCGLLGMYYVAGALACLAGFIGLIKTIPFLVGLYRDYSIVDSMLVTLGTVLSSYTVYGKPSVRASMCTELSRHQDLVGIELAAHLEMCQIWLEQAVVVIGGVMFIFMAIRIHTVILLCKYYRHLSPYPVADTELTTSSFPRIYLPATPTPTSPSGTFSFNHFEAAARSRPNPDDIVHVGRTAKRGERAAALYDFTGDGEDGSSVELQGDEAR